MSSSFSGGGGTAIRRSRQFLVSVAIALSAPVLAQPAPPAQPPAGAASSAGSASVPSEEDPLLKAASEALESKNPVHALQLLDQYVVVRPRDGRAFALKARALQDLGRYEDAVEASRQATTFSPSHSGYWNKLCWNLILAQRPLDARPACEKSRELRTNNWAAIVNVGHTWLLTGNTETAQRYYRETIWQVPDDESLKEGPLADFDIFMTNGWQRQAAQDAKQWFEQKWPQWKVVLTLNAKVEQLTRAGMSREALAPAQQSLTLGLDIFGADQPLTAHLLDQLSSVYEQMGQLHLALPLIQRALTIMEKAEGPDHRSTGTLLNNLANVLTGMGQYSQALPLIQRALAISDRAGGPAHPGAGTTLINLANLYQAIGQYSQALPLY